MSVQQQAIIVLPYLRVQNANLVSSPITWGFPSITAIMGFVHALQRKMRNDTHFCSAAIICHRFEPQVYGDYQKVFALMRKPLLKDGRTAALVEEGRTHLELSIIIKAKGTLFDIGNTEQLATDIFEQAQILRIAGGSILPSVRKSKRYLPNIELWPSYTEKQEELTKKILRPLLPGFSLISRENLLIEQTEKLKECDPNATTWDALLELSSINHEPPDEPPDEADEKPEWSIRKKPGWIVPISIGYQSISELYQPGVVKDARDNEFPFQFVENIYSLGEWINPLKMDNLEKLLWRYDIEQTKNGLYRCIN